MRELRHVTNHKSVRRLDSVQLERLTVVAGVNGAGKTHLLEAIKQGAVQVLHDGNAIDPQEIVLKDWTSLRMQPDGEVAVGGVRNEAEDLVRYVNNQLGSGKAHQALKGQREQLKLGLPDPVLLKTPLEKLQIDEDARLAVRQLRERVNKEVHAALGGNDRRRLLLAGIEQRTGRLVIELARHELMNQAMTLGLVDDPLRQELSRVILAYQRTWEDNDYARLLATSGRQSGAPFLDEADFRRCFGPPPWDVVNDLLVDLQVDLEVVPPAPRQDVYQVQLQQRSNGTPVGLDSLSSGEQVLTALVVSLYGAAGNPPTVKLPQVMLLDEVDAPLHPSMVRTLLRLVEDLLLAHEVVVVLTTHSPTTVALAPEGSVIQMNKESPRLEAVSNRRALAHLTAGLTALSISYADRRVVLTEASGDADAYSAIFDALSQRLETERGLVFLPAGTEVCLT